MRYIVTKIIVCRLEKNIKRGLSIVKPILNSNEKIYISYVIKRAFAIINFSYED